MDLRTLPLRCHVSRQLQVSSNVAKSETIDEPALLVNVTGDAPQRCKLARVLLCVPPDAIGKSARTKDALCKGLVRRCKDRLGQIEISTQEILLSGQAAFHSPDYLCEMSRRPCLEVS